VKRVTKISKYWIGIDLGSSSVKSIALSTSGEVIARGRSLLVGGAVSERPAHDWVVASREACRDLALPLEDALGIGLSGLTPSLVLVDQNGKPLRNALTWMDTRAHVEAQELEKIFGATENLLGTNLPWGPGYPPAQLKWLARHEEALVSSAFKALTVKDYVGSVLTGEFRSDVWSSKGICRVDTGSSASEIISEAGWSPKLSPDMGAPSDSRGSISAEGSRIFGLPHGLPVNIGWSDALCAMLSLGVYESPTAFALMGTSNIAGISTQSPKRIEGLLTIKPPIVPLGLIYGPTQNGGSVLEWLASLTGQSVEHLLDCSLAATGEIPNFVPFLNGERAPYWRSNLRAQMQGISTSTGVAEMAAAAILGIAGTLRSVIDSAEERNTKLMIGGKGVSHPAWKIAIEKVFESPAQFLDEDLSSLGAALLAAQSDGTVFASDLFQKPNDSESVEKVSWNFSFESWRNTRDDVLKMKGQ
jgi:xylulokinase